MPRTRAGDPEARLLALVTKEAGKRLPSERQLSSLLGIGRPALRTLLTTLEQRRLIERRHGSGTYAIESQLAQLNQVALIIDSRIRLGQDPFFAAVIESMQRELQTLGAQCQLLRYQEGADAPDAALLADASLLLGSSCGGLLARWNVDAPVVAWLISGGNAHRRASLIELEDEAAGTSAAEYLLQRGCRRLLFIGHDQHPSPRRRLAGARSAALQAGIPLGEIASGMNYEDGIHAAIAVSQHASGGLGIIAANDWLAAGVHVGLSMRSCVLPVIGFDGLPQAQALGLPSLAIPIPVIAADAISELRRLVANPNVPGRRLSYRLTLHIAGEMA